MPRVFLIKKNFGSASVTKPKRFREDGPAPITPQKHQDDSIDSTDYHSNLYIPQDLTPPRTPSSNDSITTPPPGVTLITSRSDLRNNELLSPTISEPLNLNTSSTWPKAMVPPYLPFNFTSLYPSFPQTASPDFYTQLYPVALPQRAALPAEQPSYTAARDGSHSPLKKPEPLTPLPVNANNGNDNVSSYLYRMWYSRAENKLESLGSAPATPNSDHGGETVDLKKRGSREAPRYQCSDCSKSYSTMSGLSKHQQFHCVTQAKKSFGCKYCDKVYVSLGALKMHIRTHTLPCKCKLCGKAFSRPWLLQGHVRTHTGEKPFACQHCNRAFADRSNLRAHLQTHSDVKKYSCKSCSKTFSRMSLLLKHEDGGCSGSKDEGMMTQVPR